MVDEKNHLFSELDATRDRKTINKKKEQQQFSRFSIALATSVTNANIQAVSPALQPNSQVQIGDPYDDTKGSVSTDQVIDFSTYGSQYTFYEVTADVAFTFEGLPTGRNYQFVVDILVDNAAGVNITFPTVINPPTIAGNDGDRIILKFVCVLRSDPEGINPPVETCTFLSGTEGGGGTTCPVICDEVNLGDVSGGVVIDWSLAPFFRMKLVGDISVVMNNLPASPGWHEITVEFLQDGVGNHNVAFLDIFRNDPDVIIRKGTNRYTITKFYSYFDEFDNILQWQPPFLDVINSNANQGIIHTILSADQVTLPFIPVGNHVEFDTILFTNQMNVTSGGVGQANGIFGGFIAGRTYELEGAIGALNSVSAAPAFISYQWFDIASAILIGSIGTQTDIVIASNFQQQARAFFQPQDITDTVELRIVSNNLPGIDTILSGVPPSPTVQSPQSYAIIKDCGQTPGQVEAQINEDLPDNLIPPAPPLIGFTSRMTYYNTWTNATYGTAGNLAVNGIITTPFWGRGKFTSLNVGLNDVNPVSRETMCPAQGTLKKITLRLEASSITEAMDLELMEDEIKIVTVASIPALTAGEFQWPSVGELANTPMKFGSQYYFRFRTISGINPGGFFSGYIESKIFWGGA